MSTSFPISAKSVILKIGNFELLLNPSQTAGIVLAWTQMNAVVFICFFFLGFGGEINLHPEIYAVYFLLHRRTESEQTTGNKN